MWQVKTFKTKAAFDRWIERAEGVYQFDILFINNGWGVQYRKLRRVY